MCGFGSQYIIAAVKESLPVEKVAFLLGNDTAGENVLPVLFGFAVIIRLFYYYCIFYSSSFLVIIKIYILDQLLRKIYMPPASAGVPLP